MTAAAGTREAPLSHDSLGRGRETTPQQPNRGLPTTPPRGVLRHSRWDALLVALAAAQGAILLGLSAAGAGWLAAPLVAIALWWNANTISHNFIHSPFFRARRLNRLFALYLSGLLGFPQSVWRDRHLAHHAETAWRPRWSGAILLESAVVAAVWTALAIFAPWFFLTAYLPGYVLGLGLCAVHGHYEHVRGTISHHGRFYNWLFFNDGYHVEHHASPGTHWTRLPERADPAARRSHWPAILRWLDAFSLEGLERWVLRSPRLQRFVLRRHERAFAKLLRHLPDLRRIGIIGGGLFPRTALVLRRLLPDAELTIIDANADHLAIAQQMLASGGLKPPVSAEETGGLHPPLAFIHAWFDPEQHSDFDLLVVPLAFVGDRAALYEQPPARGVLIHDWLWHRRGQSAIVSLMLFKRLNLIVRSPAMCFNGAASTIAARSASDGRAIARR